MTVTSQYKGGVVFCLVDYAVQFRPDGSFLLCLAREIELFEKHPRHPRLAPKHWNTVLPKKWGWRKIKNKRVNTLSREPRKQKLGASRAAIWNPFWSLSFWITSRGFGFLLNQQFFRWLVRERFRIQTEISRALPSNLRCRMVIIGLRKSWHGVLPLACIPS